MMTQDYRATALDVRRQAAVSPDPTSRRLLQELARAWDLLAVGRSELARGERWAPIMTP